jgi:hypothetical protein
MLRYAPSFSKDVDDPPSPPDHPYTAISIAQFLRPCMDEKPGVLRRGLMPIAVDLNEVALNPSEEAIPNAAGHGRAPMVSSAIVIAGTGPECYESGAI